MLQDFSATVNAGYGADFVCIGAVLPLGRKTSVFPNKFLTVCLDLRQGGGENFDSAEQSLVVTLDNLGNLSTVADKPGFVARAETSADAVSMEILVPASMFEQGMPSGSLRLEAVLCDNADPDQAGNLLMLSGRDPSLKNPALFAVLAKQPAAVR